MQTKPTIREDAVDMGKPERQRERERDSLERDGKSRVKKTGGCEPRWSTRPERSTASPPRSTPPPLRVPKL